MRRSRLALLAALTLALLGGSTTAALAQADDELVVTATQVTGATIDKHEVYGGSYPEADGVDQLREAIYEHTFEWSDPRLPPQSKTVTHGPGSDASRWRMRSVHLRR